MGSYSSPSRIRIALVGDRAVAVASLEFLLSDDGADLVALGVSGPGRATHADELRSLAGSGTPTLVGDELRSESGRELLAEAEPDILLSVHFPYIIPEAVLQLPTIGAYNLHPGFLPYGRGWNTVSWGLLEGAPVGCTLHRMTAEVDRGPIVAQQEIVPTRLETAHELYLRILSAEVELLRSAWVHVRKWPDMEHPQPVDAPPTRHAGDLESVIDRDLESRDSWPTAELIRVLRALTTSDAREAARVTSPDGTYAIRMERLPDSNRDAER